MLGYVSKNKDKPSCLDGMPVTRNGYAGGNIYFLSSCTDIYQPPSQDTPLIKIDDNLSVYQLAGSIDLAKVAKVNKIGMPIKLGDSQCYYFPKLRCFPDGSQLPSRLMLTENGIQYRVKSEHLIAWQFGQKLWSFMVEKAPMTDDEIVDAITCALQVNYNITKYDVLCYGLIDTNVEEVISHLLDLKTWLEHVKVTEQEQAELLKKKLE